MGVAASVAVWTIVGVPVAVAIAMLRVFVWVFASLPEMIVTAAVLGLVHGLWLSLAGRPFNGPDRHWFGPASGSFLGLLGLPPVFSRINGVVVDCLTATVFLTAAVVAGLIAGLVSVRVVMRVAGGRRFALGDVVLVGSLLVLPVAVLDYRLYWPEMADRLPVRRVSPQSIANVMPGDARGSTWAGCYQYLGAFSRGSGLVGKEGGILNVTQMDGVLTVNDLDTPPLVGAVDVGGHFHFGGQRMTGQDTLRVLWEGTFKDNSLEFARRITVLRGDAVLNSTQLTGTAQRCRR